MRPLNVFVSIPHGYRALLENAIKPLEGGRLCVVSFFEHGSYGPFAASIRNHIALSNVVIAILTGANDNVLYEVGLAIGNNRPVILVTTDAASLPSMIRHFNAVVYDPLVPDWKALHTILADRCQDILHGHYGPLRSRTHNEILIRQRTERSLTAAELSKVPQQNPIELAINAYDKGEYDQVIGHLTPFATDGILRSDVYFYLSDAHFLRGESLTAPGPKITCYRQQKEVATRAIELNQARQDTVKNLGLAHLKLGELDEAEKIFRGLIDQYPTYEVAQYNLACVYAQRGPKFRLRCIGELTDLVARDGEWRYIARIDPDLDPLWEDDLFQALLFPRPRHEG